jgi:hypothetical protein
MDDILIHARTKEDLEKRTKRVLERLKEHNLYLKPEKCKFERTEVEFLGTILSENTIRMDPIKLAGIRDWPSLTTVKQNTIISRIWKIIIEDSFPDSQKSHDHFTN